MATKNPDLHYPRSIKKYLQSNFLTSTILTQLNFKLPPNLTWTVELQHNNILSTQHWQSSVNPLSFCPRPSSPPPLLPPPPSPLSLPFLTCTRVVREGMAPGLRWPRGGRGEGSGWESTSSIKAGAVRSCLTRWATKAGRSRSISTRLGNRVAMSTSCTIHSLQTATCGVIVSTAAFLARPCHQCQSQLGLKFSGYSRWHVSRVCRREVALGTLVSSLPS